MEYTKDMIFQVHYDEAKHVIDFRTKNRTSRFWQSLKKHKLITAGVLIGVIFIAIDGILVMNFINVLESL